jgi:hypothetical protein
MPFSAAQVAPNSFLARGSTAFNIATYLDRLFPCGRAGCVGFLLSFLLTVLTVLPAGAQVAIEARVGYHGVFQLGRPFPLDVELSNTGRPADGILDVQVWKGGATKGGTPYPVRYRREVFLAAQSRKTLQLTVDPDFISRPLTILFTSRTITAAR